MIKEIVNRIRAQTQYDFENHMHYVRELYKDGQNYYIHIIETEGSGKILCKNALVGAAIRAQPDYSVTKDYQVDMIPIVQYRKPQSRTKIQSLAPLRSIQVQVGGQFPPDMNFDGCADLALNLTGDLKEAIYYTEPVVEGLKTSGAVGIYLNPTPFQKKVIQDYAMSTSTGLTSRPESLIKMVCSIGLIKPTFDQFRTGLDNAFPALAGYASQVRVAGLTVTAASWDDDSYQIPIMLDHLHNHAYAHNGMQEASEIRELMDLLGGRSITTAHVVHSLLHIYDTLYMVRKSEQSWTNYMDYLETTILNIIPDERDRRCFFRLVNRRADQFLAKDKDEYIAPYQMILDAIPDKTRQYRTKIAQLIIPFGRQLSGNPIPQTGTTSLLPNQDP